MLALAFCDKDYLIAEKLLGWIAELDEGQNQHSLLLMASGGMSESRRKPVEATAKLAFAGVFSRMPSRRDERGWPMSCNTLFLTCYHELKRMKAGPFMWIEPDCVPLKPGWIDALVSEYETVKKPFMGCVYPHPRPHLTGCAIYPTDLAEYNPEILASDKVAWDVVNPAATIPFTHRTNQFQHVWGNFKYNIAPSFPNQASLELLRPEAVLFHRCKDGSLIDRLRERKRFPKFCRIMAKLQNPSNRFQDFPDVDFATQPSPAA